MKLRDLKSILYSGDRGPQYAIIYDRKEDKDLAICAIEAAIEEYGDRTVHQIEACGGELLIHV